MPIALEFWYSLFMAIKSVNSQRIRKQEDISLCYITKQGNFMEPLRWLRHYSQARSSVPNDFFFFFAKFRCHGVKNEKVTMENLSQLNAPVLQSNQVKRSRR